MQFFHPLQSLAGGQHPLHPALFQQHDVLAEVGNVLGVVLDDDDGLAVPLVQLPQHPIDAVGVGRVQLGDGLVQDQDVGLQRQSPRQRQQMGLPARQLPDEITLPAAQAAPLQRRHAPLLIVRHGVVLAGVGGVVQHGGTDDLIFKVLVYIPDLPGQGAHVACAGIQPAGKDAPRKIAADELGDQTVEGLAKSGLSTSIVAHNGEKVPLFHTDGNILQRRMRCARIGIGQVIYFYRVHKAQPL